MSYSAEDLDDFMFSPIEPDEDEIITFDPDDIDSFINDVDVPKNLPILPLRNTVLFPGVVIPISVGRNKSLELIHDYFGGSQIIGAVSQKDINVNDPQEADLNRIGTVGKIVKILQMPNDAVTVIIQGKQRFRLEKIVEDEPYFIGNVKILEEKQPQRKKQEFAGLVSSIKDLSLKIIKYSHNIPPESEFAIRNIDNALFLINFVCSNSNLSLKEKQQLLEYSSLHKRGKVLLEYLTREVQKLEIKQDIQSKVKTEIDQQQREYFLHQQIKTIQDELGDDPVKHELKELRQEAKKKKWGKKVQEAFDKDLKRLERINPASPDYSSHLTYLQVLLELPWEEYTEDNFDLKNAQQILDEDHYGLDNVKDRILEHLAVLKLKGDMKSPILCLYGPPGVGKTSLGKSVARALKRKYVRMSLGGLHDEAEIRGHRKTYIGAMPGRIIQNLRKAKTSNPVFILDEIDKIGKDFRGDPSYALLEVLDPEQNNTFQDNYLELEYDLSKVLFIATANTLAPINPALRDRMEMINVNGYIVEEKIEIAKRHLLPKQLKEHGVKSRDLRLNKPVLEFLIENYTRESGVRELNKRLAKVVRSVAKKIGMEEEYNVSLKKEDIYEILGPAKYIKQEYQGNEMPGVVTGLAWTAAGGQILYVESSLSKGKGNLTLTGNLGEVMKESAMIALEYVRAHAAQLKIKPEKFLQTNVHIHVPEGAIPKDGPSAGITMLTSLASIFSGRKVRKGLAMTGEITLRGKLLPVGGIKEKILAAKRAGITDVVLSKHNQKDVEVIKEIYLKGLHFHYFDSVSKVLDFVLLKSRATQ